ncbi:MAG: hypothetical protein JWR72_831 [Flavisolibacter sp.]|nr:hypothetical protein [Flavisolibacter sp.]
MNKCYLLLRNNKETGPFLITELLQLSLTANDLVWVQGESAGWRYPLEVDELKEALVNEGSSLNPTVSKNAEPVVASFQKEDKASPKKIFVSLPTAIKNQPAVTTPSFEEKAEALRQKALSFSKDKEDITEVRYTRSLDEIKEEYTGWIHEQKKKRKGFSINQPLAFTVLFAAITASAFFVLQWNPKKEKAVPTLTLAAKKVTPVTKNKAGATVATKEVTPVTNSQRDTPFAHKEIPEKPESGTSQLAEQAVSKEIFVKTVAKPLIITDPSLTIPKTAEQSSVPLLKETVLRKKEADIPIADLMETKSHYIQSKEGIGISVQLHNKSAKSIRVAAIDVIYFNKAKVQTAKETLYFSNVQPGTTLTKNSSYVKAVSASYSIGLVSAESAGLYVMQ